MRGRYEIILILLAVFSMALTDRNKTQAFRLQTLNQPQIFVYAPKVILPKENYRIHVHSFGRTQEAPNVTAYLKNQDGQFICGKNEITTSKTRAPDVKPVVLTLKTKCLNPHGVQNFSLNITVNWNGAVQWQNFSVKGIPEEKLILIQLDKPVYKPEETLSYRIIVLDDAAQPDGIQEVHVKFKFRGLSRNVSEQSSHPDGKVMPGEEDKQPFFNNRTGYFEGNYTFSKLRNAPVGQWELKVIVPGRHHTAKKRFTVKKYVASRFYAEFDLPAHITMDDARITGTVSARYHFGKPVFGQMNISAVFVSGPSNADREVRVLPVGREQGITLNETQQWYSTDKLFDLGTINNQIKKYKLCNVNGKGDFPEGHHFLVEVNITEEATGQRIRDSQRLQFHCQPFRIVTDEQLSPSLFYPGSSSTYNITGRLEHYNGSSYRLPRNTNPTLTVTTCTRNWPNGSRPAAWDCTSIPKIQIPVTEGRFLFRPDMDKRKHDHHVRFRFELAHVRTYVRVDNALFLAYPSGVLLIRVETGETLTTNGSNVTFKIVRTANSICRGCRLYYAVLTRLGIEKTTFDMVRDDDIVAFHTNAAMWPISKLFVYYMTRDGILGVAVTNFAVERVPINTLKLELTNYTRTSSGAQQICASVKTDAGSLVGFSAIDHGVLRKTNKKKGHFSFKSDYVNRQLAQLNTVSWFSGRGTADVSVLPALKTTDILNEAKLVGCSFVSGNTGKACAGLDETHKNISDGKSGSSERPETAPEQEYEERDDFRDVFLDKVGFADKEGYIQMCDEVPDSMTKWNFSAFAINDQAGLLIDDNSPKLAVLQDVFIDFILPYQLSLGNDINIPILVFNYGNKVQDVAVRYKVTFCRKATERFCDNEAIILPETLNSNVHLRMMTAEKPIIIKVPKEVMAKYGKGWIMFSSSVDNRGFLDRVVRRVRIA